MNLLVAFVKSLSDLSWLKAQKNRTGFGFGYFFAFTAVSSLLFLIPVSLLVPKALREAHTQIQALPDFTAEVKGGTLTVSGIEQPLVRRFDDKVGVVLVIDTVSTTSPSLESYRHAGESGVLVARDRIEFFDARQNQMRTTFLKDSENTTLTRADVIRWTDTYVTPKIAVVVVIAMVVGIFIGFSIANLLALLIVAAILRVAAGIANRQWRFGELFTVGLFAGTLPSLATLVLSWFGLGIPRLHFWALLAFMIAVVFTKDSSESVKSESL